MRTMNGTVPPTHGPAGKVMDGGWMGKCDSKPPNPPRLPLQQSPSCHCQRTVRRELLQATPRTCLPFLPCPQTLLCRVHRSQGRCGQVTLARAFAFIAWQQDSGQSSEA